MFLTRDKPQQWRFFTGGYWTAWTTTTTSLASQWGLLINIDSATGNIAQTASGWIEDEKYGFYAREQATSTSAEFDTAVLMTWAKTLKLETLDATWNIRCFPAPLTNYSTAATNLANSHYFIPCKGSTKYRFKLKAISTNLISSGFQAYLQEMNSSWTAWATSTTINITWTTAETIYTVVWTTAASAVKLWFFFWISAWNIASVSIDVNSMTLEEVIEPVANSLVTPSPSLVSFTAVGSTDNIDQSFTTTPDGSIVVGDVGGLDYMDSQSFTPTKSKHTWVYLYKRANSWTPTWNLKIDVRTDNGSWDPTSTILATTTIPLATYNALSTNAEFLVNLPCNVTPWTKHHYVATNTANESAWNWFNLWCLVAWWYTWWDARFSTDWWTVWTINGSRDFYFKTLYYKPTTNFKASQNNLSVSVSADEDGFLDGSVLNLTTGTYTWWMWATPSDLSMGTNVFRSTVWAGNAVTTQNIIQNYGYYNYNGKNWIWNAASATTQDLVWKCETILPITSSVIVSLTATTRTTWDVTVAYSTDDSTYTDLWSLGNSSNVEADFSYSTSSLIWFTKFYIRIRRSWASSKFDIANLAISTTVNPLSLSTLRNYPTNKDIIKQYSTTLGGATTTATYRATKWGFPAIEYSATEYQFLDVDTTATGSTVAFSELWTTYTTVADGASLAISSTSTPNIFVKANITANRIYSSSNDYVASSDKDGSLRQTLTYQVVQ